LPTAAAAAQSVAVIYRYALLGEAMLPGGLPADFLSLLGVFCLVVAPGYQS
jgi:hypothetical protein